MADIGTTLREARIRARIDISEVEARTKIRAKYLRAIENEEWDLLPGPVYVKSFLRTYGDFLGVDSRLLVDEYKRRYERPADQDLRPITARSPRARTQAPAPPAGTGGRRRARARCRGRRGAVRGRQPQHEQLDVEDDAAHHRRFEVHSTTTTHTTTTHAPPPQPPAPPKPTTVTLKLVPTSSVYVCVEDGTGKKLIPGLIFAVGQTIPTETASKLMVTLGNPSVQMKVNGKTVTVANSSPIGYELTPGKTTPLPAGQLPTCT